MTDRYSGLLCSNNNLASISSNGLESSWRNTLCNKRELTPRNIAPQLFPTQFWTSPKEDNILSRSKTFIPLDRYDESRYSYKIAASPKLEFYDVPELVEAKDTIHIFQDVSNWFDEQNGSNIEYDTTFIGITNIPMEWKSFPVSAGRRYKAYVAARERKQVRRWKSQLCKLNMQNKHLVSENLSLDEQLQISKTDRHSLFQTMMRQEKEIKATQDNLKQATNEAACNRVLVMESQFKIANLNKENSELSDILHLALEKRSGKISKETPKQETSTSTCCICFDAPFSAFFGCGHATFCFDCAKKINRCPICNHQSVAKKLFLN